MITTRKMVTTKKMATMMNTITVIKKDTMMDITMMNTCQTITGMKSIQALWPPRSPLALLSTVCFSLNDFSFTFNKNFQISKI